MDQIMDFTLCSSRFVSLTRLCSVSTLHVLVRCSRALGHGHGDIEDPK